MATKQQQNEFIAKIAPLTIKYAEKYGFNVVSPAIAQACLESGYGTGVYNDNRNKVINPYTGEWRHNYFGMKYRANRVNCHCGYFSSSGTEQKADGSYTPTTTDWYKFASLEKCVEGYYQFINISRYAAVKAAQDPLTYLQAIKAAGYASSLNYVENVYNVIKEHNLTEFDKKMSKNIGNSSANISNGFSNSSLISFTKLSPHFHERKQKITKITIHHMAGNLTIESCANVFCGTRKASSNYGIGTDGRIGLYVEEKNQAITSSSEENDQAAVTIEVANNSGAPNWTVSDAAFSSLINLCVDICKRNNIKQINYTGNKTGNLTMHKWFKATACPGPYLEAKFPEIANLINAKLLNSGNIAENLAQNTTQPKQDGTFITYIIQRGDTLNKIAAKFETTAEKIAEINGIKDINKIITGKPLKIAVQGIMTVKTNGSALNIRSETNAHCPVLGAIPNKQKVNLIKKTNAEWYKIEYNGIVGFCSAKYLI